MTTREVALAVLLAIFFTATGGTDFEPDGVQAIVAAAYVIGLVLLGALGGWRALLLFTLAYAVAAVAHQMFFWTDDPTRSGTDDIDPIAGAVVTLPFALLVVALGALLRRLPRPRLSRSAR